MKKMIIKNIEKEKEYQELLRTRNSIALQIEELDKKFDDEMDSNEDYQILNKLQETYDKLNYDIKRMEKDSNQQESSYVKLDESLLKESDSSKSYDYSL